MSGKYKEIIELELVSNVKEVEKNFSSLADELEYLKTASSKVGLPLDNSINKSIKKLAKLKEMVSDLHKMEEDGLDTSDPQMLHILNRTIGMYREIKQEATSYNQVVKNSASGVLGSLEKNITKLNKMTTAISNTRAEAVKLFDEIKNDNISSLKDLGGLDKFRAINNQLEKEVALREKLVKLQSAVSTSSLPTEVKSGIASTLQEQDIKLTNASTKSDFKEIPTSLKEAERLLQSLDKEVKASINVVDKLKSEGVITEKAYKDAVRQIELATKEAYKLGDVDHLAKLSTSIKKVGSDFNRAYTALNNTKAHFEKAGLDTTQLDELLRKYKQIADKAFSGNTTGLKELSAEMSVIEKTVPKITAKLSLVDGAFDAMKAKASLSAEALDELRVKIDKAFNKAIQSNSTRPLDEMHNRIKVINSAVDRTKRKLSDLSSAPIKIDMSDLNKALAKAEKIAVKTGNTEALDAVYKQASDILKPLEKQYNLYTKLTDKAQDLAKELSLSDKEAKKMLNDLKAMAELDINKGGVSNLQKSEASLKAIESLIGSINTKAKKLNFAQSVEGIDSPHIKNIKPKLEEAGKIAIKTGDISGLEKLAYDVAQMEKPLKKQSKLIDSVLGKYSHLKDALQLDAKTANKLYKNLQAVAELDIRSGSTENLSKVEATLKDIESTYSSILKKADALHRAGKITDNEFKDLEATMKSIASKDILRFDSKGVKEFSKEFSAITPMITKAEKELVALSNSLRHLPSGVKKPREEVQKLRRDFEEAKRQAFLLGNTDALKNFTKDFEALQPNLKGTINKLGSVRKQLIDLSATGQFTLSEMKQLVREMHRVANAGGSINTKGLDVLAIKLKELQNKAHIKLAIETSKESKLSWVKEQFKRGIFYTGMYLGLGNAIQGISTLVRTGTNQVLAFDTAVRTMSAVFDVSYVKATKLAYGLNAISRAYGGTTDEIKQSALTLGRAGIAYDQLLDASEVVLKMSKLTGDTIDSSASALISYQQVFKDDLAHGQTLKDFGDQLSYVANQSRMATTDINTFANYALATAKGAGFTKESINAMAIAFSNAGVNASTIGTQIRRFTSLLHDESSATKSFFTSMGINQQLFARQIAKGGEEADKALEKFVSKLHGLSANDFLKITGGMDILAKNSLQLLRNTSEEFKRHLANLRNGVTGELDATDIITQGYQASIEKIVASYEHLVTTFTSKYSGSISGALDSIASGIERIGVFLRNNQESINTFFSVVGNVSKILATVFGLKLLGTTIVKVFKFFVDSAKDAKVAVRELKTAMMSVTSMQPTGNPLAPITTGARKGKASLMSFSATATRTVGKLGMLRTAGVVAGRVLGLAFGPIGMTLMTIVPLVYDFAKGLFSSNKELTEMEKKAKKVREEIAQLASKRVELDINSAKQAGQTSQVSNLKNELVRVNKEIKIAKKALEDLNIKQATISPEIFAKLKSKYTKALKGLEARKLRLKVVLDKSTALQQVTQLKQKLQTVLANIASIKKNGTYINDVGEVNQIKTQQGRDVVVKAYTNLAERLKHQIQSLQASTEAVKQSIAEATHTYGAVTKGDIKDLGEYVNNINNAIKLGVSDITDYITAYKNKQDELLTTVGQGMVGSLRNQIRELIDTLGGDLSEAERSFIDKSLASLQQAQATAVSDPSASIKAMSEAILNMSTAMSTMNENAKGSAETIKQEMENVLKTEQQLVSIDGQLKANSADITEAMQKSNAEIIKQAEALAKATASMGDAEAITKIDNLTNHLVNRLQVAQQVATSAMTKSLAEVQKMANKVLDIKPTKANSEYIQAWKKDAVEVLELIDLINTNQIDPQIALEKLEAFRKKLIGNNKNVINLNNSLAVTEQNILNVANSSNGLVDTINLLNRVKASLYDIGNITVYPKIITTNIVRTVTQPMNAPGVIPAPNIGLGGLAKAYAPKAITPQLNTQYKTVAGFIGKSISKSISKPLRHFSSNIGKHLKHLGSTYHAPKKSRKTKKHSGGSNKTNEAIAKAIELLSNKYEEKKLNADKTASYQDYLNAMKLTGQAQLKTQQEIFQIKFKEKEIALEELKAKLAVYRKYKDKKKIAKTKLDIKKLHKDMIKMASDYALTLAKGLKSVLSSSLHSIFTGEWGSAMKNFFSGLKAQLLKPLEDLLSTKLANSLSQFANNITQSLASSLQGSSIGGFLGAGGASALASAGVGMITGLFGSILDGLLNDSEEYIARLIRANTGKKDFKYKAFDYKKFTDASKTAFATLSPYYVSMINHLKNMDRALTSAGVSAGGQGFDITGKRYVGSYKKYALGFGNKKTSLLDAGLIINNLSVNGADVSNYSKERVDKTKWWGLSHSTSVNSHTEVAPDKLRDSITKAYAEQVQGIANAMESMGYDAKELFKNKVNIGSISTKGLSDAEIASRINQAIQEAIDKNLAQIGNDSHLSIWDAIDGVINPFGSHKYAKPKTNSILEAVKEFQTAGESTQETLTRLATTFMQVNEAFKVLGVTAVKSKDGLSKIQQTQYIVQGAGGEESFQKGIQALIEMTDSKLSDFEKATRQLSGVLGTTKYFKDHKADGAKITYKDAKGAKASKDATLEDLAYMPDKFKELIQAYKDNLQTKGDSEKLGELIKIMPELEKLAKAIQELKKGIDGAFGYKTTNDLVGGYLKAGGSSKDFFKDFTQGAISQEDLNKGLSIYQEKYLTDAEKRQSAREELLKKFNDLQAKGELKGIDFASLVQSRENYNKVIKQYLADIKSGKKKGKDLGAIMSLLSVSDKYFSLADKTADRAKKAILKLKDLEGLYTGSLSYMTKQEQTNISAMLASKLQAKDESIASTLKTYLGSLQKDSGTRQDYTDKFVSTMEKIQLDASKDASRKDLLEALNSINGNIEYLQEVTRDTKNAG